MSALFVVGISWRTAPVAVREKLAFREEELTAALTAITKDLPVGEALLISTCNRVEIYGWRGRRAARLTLEGFATALAVLIVYLVRRIVG